MINAMNLNEEEHEIPVFLYFCVWYVSLNMSDKNSRDDAAQQEFVYWPQMDFWLFLC